MIHMSPYQSWSTVLLLVAFTAALVWLIHTLNQARAERSRLAASATDAELRPAGARLLTLVPDLPREPASREVYDWQISGL